MITKESKYIQIVFLFIALITNVSAQSISQIDSLERRLKLQKTDSAKTEIKIQLYSLYFATDTLKANSILAEIAHAIDNDKYEIPPRLIFEVGNLYYNYKNDYSNTIKYMIVATQKAKTLNNKKFVFYESWLGYIYSLSGEHQKARKHLINAVQYAENNKIINELPFSYLLLAFVYRNANELDKAIVNFNNSYTQSLENKDSTYIHTALHEIGNIYNMQRNYSLAIEYHKKALIIREVMGSTAYLMYSYNDIANDYFSVDSVQTALNYYRKAEKIAEEQNNKFALFRILGGIESCYNLLNDNQNRLKYLLAMQKIADELNILTIYSELYIKLYEYNKSSGNYSDALMYLEKSVLYKDSLSNEEIRKNLNELDKKYETVKKDKEIIENQAYIKRQKTIIVFTIIVSMVIAIFMFIVFRQYRQKKEAYTTLEVQNQKIVQQNTEIQQQAQNLEYANTEITQQKSIVEKSHKQIKSSINYAKRIQEAVLPKDELMQMLFPQNFVLFLPKDIVSGDFYFVKLYKNLLFIAVADCTGHGVPGAFMSMLGIALLNELIRRPEINTPAMLLNELRTQIKNSLQQTGQKGEQQDGMDIAFACIDIENQLLNFSGANNPLYIFRDTELIELKADKMPVGIYRNEHSFTNHQVQLQKNDTLYLFSDGYYSQFRHTNMETIKIKRFRELLQQLHLLDFDEQKNKLHEFLHVWKGDVQQTDDVLVVGFKICM